MLDSLTGLVWRQQDRLDCGSCYWSAAAAAVTDLAKRSYQPWRLPTIRELERLVDASRHSPALPVHHCFFGVGDTYWS